MEIETEKGRINPPALEVLAVAQVVLVRSQVALEDLVTRVGEGLVVARGQMTVAAVDLGNHAVVEVVSMMVLEARVAQSTKVVIPSTFSSCADKHLNLYKRFAKKVFSLDVG